MKIHPSLLYIFFLLFAVVSCSRQTEKLEQVEKMMQSQPDSAWAILQKIPTNQLHSRSDKVLYALLYTQAQNKRCTIPSSDSLINIATDYYDESNPERAGYAWYYKSRFSQTYEDIKQQVSALMRAEEYAVLSGDNKLRAIILSDKAELYFNQQKYDSALICNKRAAILFQAIHDTYNTIICLLRIEDEFICKDNTDSALVYDKIAEKLAIELHDPALTSTIYRGFGRVYSIKNDNQQALYFYRKVPLTNNSLYDENRNLMLATTFLNMNRLDSATYYLNRIKEHQNDNSYFSKLWIKIYEKKGDYKKALSYSQRVTAINDSLYKRNLDVSFAGLEKKYNFQSLKLTNQYLTLHNKRYIIAVLILLLGIVASATFFLWWRNGVRKKLIHNQQIALEQEQKLLQHETQNRELAELQLENEKQLLEQQLLNNKLIETQLRVQKVLFLNMEQYKKHVFKPTKGVHPLVSPIDNPVFYQQLIVSMDLEYDNISQRLKTQYPDLSEKDILICCFILAGFDSGMIASVLGIQLDSVNKSRYRIRKRFNIETSEKMEDYMLSL